MWLLLVAMYVCVFFLYRVYTCARPTQIKQPQRITRKHREFFFISCRIYRFFSLVFPNNFFFSLVCFFEAHSTSNEDYIWQRAIYVHLRKKKKEREKKYGRILYDAQMQMWYAMLQLFPMRLVY